MNVKDRLTAHNKAGQGIINMDGVSDVLEASARIRTFSPLIISKLTEYEDTGLSPNEIERLKSENAALRERLERAVELPCRIGDTLYGVYNDKVAEYIVIGLNVLADWTLEIYLKTQNKKQNRFSTFSTSIGVRYFKDREAAEKRLAELNGGKQ